MQANGHAYEADLFQVTLLGRTVECISLSDAAAVKTANDILLGDDPTPYASSQLAPLADVLVRYGQRWAADKLTGLNL
jgi:hypothetical protein